MSAPEGALTQSSEPIRQNRARDPSPLGIRGIVGLKAGFRPVTREMVVQNVNAAVEGLVERSPNEQVFQDVVDKLRKYLQKQSLGDEYLREILSLVAEEAVKENLARFWRFRSMVLKTVGLGTSEFASLNGVSLTPEQVHTILLAELQLGSGEVADFLKKMAKVPGRSCRKTGKISWLFLYRELKASGHLGLSTESIAGNSVSVGSEDPRNCEENPSSSHDRSPASRPSVLAQKQIEKALLVSELKQLVYRKNSLKNSSAKLMAGLCEIDALFREAEGIARNSVAKKLPHAPRMPQFISGVGAVNSAILGLSASSFHEFTDRVARIRDHLIARNSTLRSRVLKGEISLFKQKDAGLSAINAEIIANFSGRPLDEVDIALLDAICLHRDKMTEFSPESLLENTLSNAEDSLSQVLEQQDDQTDLNSKLASEYKELEAQLLELDGQAKLQAVETLPEAQISSSNSDSNLSPTSNTNALANVISLLKKPEPRQSALPLKNTEPNFPSFPAGHQAPQQNSKLDENAETPIESISSKKKVQIQTKTLEESKRSIAESKRSILKNKKTVSEHHESLTEVEELKANPVVEEIKELEQHLEEFKKSEKGIPEKAEASETIVESISQQAQSSKKIIELSHNDKASQRMINSAKDIGEIKQNENSDHQIITSTYKVEEKDSKRSIEGVQKKIQGQEDYPFGEKPFTDEIDRLNERIRENSSSSAQNVPDLEINARLDLQELGSVANEPTEFSSFDQRKSNRKIEETIGNTARSSDKASEKEIEPDNSEEVNLNMEDQSLTEEAIENVKFSKKELEIDEASDSPQIFAKRISFQKKADEIPTFEQEQPTLVPSE